MALIATSSVVLAAGNPEKHPCPVGQTWVVEKGIGKCKPLAIKPNTGNQGSPLILPAVQSSKNAVQPLSEPQQSTAPSQGHQRTRGETTLGDVTVSAANQTRSTSNSVAAPAKPKPDFTIVAAKPIGAQGNYRVTVKNTGGDHYAEMVLWGTHQKKGGQSWGAAANIKTVFGAGEQKYIDVTFASGDFARGDRLMFEVDYYKAVAETDENNNKYATSF